MQTGVERSVRKWVLLAIMVAGCSRGPAVGTSLTGAPSPREAATAFINAVKAQDLQAMGAVWGTEKGPARDQLDRDQLDKRLVLLQQCYDHDRFQILDELMGSDGGRVVRIQVTRGNRTKTPSFKMILGPSSRWYVLDADYETVQADFCVRSAPTGRSEAGR